MEKNTVGFAIILKIQISKIYSINIHLSDRNQISSSQLNLLFKLYTNLYLELIKQIIFSRQIWKIILAKYLLLFWVWRNYLPTLPTLSAKVRKEKRNLIWSIGKRIIGLSWQTTDLFQQHVNGITTLLLCKDRLRQGILKEWTEHFRQSHFLKYNLVGS